eukprot:jgi/Undpi1/8360/HiC_scaffold_25.g10828.m1
MLVWGNFAVWKEEVLLERKGATGGVARLTLNKPERLNALSLSIVGGMSDAVEEHFGRGSHGSSAAEGRGEGGGREGDVEERGVRLLVLRGAGGKAFCAGGDVKAIAETKSLGPGVGGTLRSDFFREEYRLDYRLATIARQKALLSLWDGVVMGGGVGISIHGTFRVATETVLFAMPETAIGMLPDVGTAYVLSRLPGGLGQYLGLTGARLRGDDLLYCGLATHLVPRERLPELEEALSEDDGRNPALVLGRFVSGSTQPGASMLAKNKRWIDETFAGASSVEDIVRKLEARARGVPGDQSGDQSGNRSSDASDDKDSSGREWAQETLKNLAKSSPTALKVAHRHIAWASTASLKNCFEQDFRVVQHVMAHPDFGEGVRALLVDKDNKPGWVPNTLDGVSDSALEAFFAPIGDEELVIGGV